MTDRASRPALDRRPATRRPVDPNPTTVVLSEPQAVSVESIMAALPDPSTLARGALVCVPAGIEAPRSFSRSLLAVFGRTKSVPRVARCTALVARGYVDVGAAEDADGDIAWGYAPGPTVAAGT